ncbi:MAG: porin family protein [Candidatus Aminicenantes bacterium]|nr:porin family protein [Candidatus Aminicenantes bacterium]
MKFKVFRKYRVLSLFFGLFLILVFSGVTHAQKFQFSLFGGLNHVLEYGSEDDYIFAENDFPVTPAHTPVSFGAGFAGFLTNNIGVELDGRYTLSSKVTLQDPSDEDTIEYDTAKHYTITVSLIYRFLSGKFRPYVVLGGGIDKLLVEDETYTSEYGYEIEFLTPEKTIDPLVSLGGGVQYFFNDNLGVRLDFRYVVIFDDPDNVNNLNVVAGVCLGF